MADRCDKAHNKMFCTTCKQYGRFNVRSGRINGCGCKPVTMKNVRISQADFDRMAKAVPCNWKFTIPKKKVNNNYMSER